MKSKEKMWKDNITDKLNRLWGVMDEDKEYALVIDNTTTYFSTFTISDWIDSFNYATFNSEWLRYVMIVSNELYKGIRNDTIPYRTRTGI